jgi:hypothetical protein
MKSLVLTVSLLFLVGCGGGGSSEPTQVNNPNDSIAGQQDIEPAEQKLLNEEIVGYWTTHVYDQNDRVSSMMFMYTFDEDGTVLVETPYGHNSHTQTWEYKNGKIKLFYTDGFVELEPIKYESEINKVIRMKYEYSSGGTGFYAWDKDGGRL